jgi:hypothetical protein
MAQGKNSEQDPYFYITHIKDEAVIRYNLEIEKNASSFVIQLNK